MSKIRESARGQDCLVRLPGVCSFNRETVIAAHIRISGLCGIGIKPSDLLTVRACSNCHDVMDGRAKAAFPAEQLKIYVHEAHCRTLVEYEKEGLVTTPKKPQPPVQDDMPEALKIGNYLHLAGIDFVPVIVKDADHRAALADALHEALDTLLEGKE